MGLFSVQSNLSGSLFSNIKQVPGKYQELSKSFLGQELTTCMREKKRGDGRGVDKERERDGVGTSFCRITTPLLASCVHCVI